MTPHFFPSPAEWRAWLEKHDETRRELWVGFYQKTTGKPSITWPESVDEANRRRREITRLATLIVDSEKGRTIAPLTRKKG